MGRKGEGREVPYAPKDGKEDVDPEVGVLQRGRRSASDVGDPPRTQRRAQSRSPSDSFQEPTPSSTLSVPSSRATGRKTHATALEEDSKRGEDDGELQEDVSAEVTSMGWARTDDDLADVGGL